MIKKTLLHIVDPQNTFMQKFGILYVNGADKIIEPTNKFISVAKFDKYIVTMDTHYRKTYTKTLESKLFKLHADYGTRDWKLAINMTVPYTRVLKGQFDVWAKPKKMEMALREHTSQNTQIAICGVASDYCVRDAINGYLMRGYNVAVISDLCQGIGRQIDQVVNEEFGEYVKTKKLVLMTAAQWIKQNQKAA
ncbi:isochorismatase family protein [Lachnospiraceae bacterium OttesenSCG-928-E19]|nr:isochorismatase family protein [Lachnospiraceae bacterium OttesenSCG-928-E19]